MSDADWVNQGEKVRDRSNVKRLRELLLEQGVLMQSPVLYCTVLK